MKDTALAVLKLLVVLDARLDTIQREIKTVRQVVLELQAAEHSRLVRDADLEYVEMYGAGNERGVA